MEPLGAIPHETAQPCVAEIHQFAILDIAKVRWVSKYGVEGARRERFGRGARAANGDVTRVFASALLADPLAFDWHDVFAGPVAADFKRLVAVALGLRVLGGDVVPAAGADVRSFAVADPKQVGLALY